MWAVGHVRNLDYNSFLAYATIISENCKHDVPGSCKELRIVMIVDCLSFLCKAYFLKNVHGSGLAYMEVLYMRDNCLNMSRGGTQLLCEACIYEELKINLNG